MKKILRLVTTSVLTLTLVACGEASSSVSSSVSSSASSSVASSSVASSFAAVTSITLAPAATDALTQVVGSLKTVVINASFNAGVNPDLRVSWLVNGVASQQTGRAFEFTPTEAGVFKIKARVGTVESQEQTVTVTAQGVSTLSITSHEFVSTTRLEVEATGGAEVVVTGATLDKDASFYDLEGKKYVLILEEALEQGDSVKVSLTRDGSTAEDTFVYDTRKLELDLTALATTYKAAIDAKEATFTATKITLVRPHVLNADGNINQTTTNWAFPVKVTDLDGEEVPFSVTRTSAPAGALASGVNQGSVDIADNKLANSASIKVEVALTRETPVGDYVYSIQVGAKTIPLTVTVVDTTPTLDLDVELAAANTGSAKTSFQVTQDSDSKISSVTGTGTDKNIFEVTKDYVLASVDFKTIKFSFEATNISVPANLLGTVNQNNAVKPNQMLVSLAGPGGISFMRVDTTSNSQESLPLPVAFRNYDTIDVVQRIDSTTPVGDYVYTARILQLGTEIHRKSVTVTVKAPEAKLSFAGTMSTPSVMQKDDVLTGMLLHPNTSINSTVEYIVASELADATSLTSPTVGDRYFDTDKKLYEYQQTAAEQAGPPVVPAVFGWVPLTGSTVPVIAAGDLLFVQSTRTLYKAEADFTFVPVTGTFPAAGEVITVGTTSNLATFSAFVFPGGSAQAAAQDTDRLYVTDTTAYRFNFAGFTDNAASRGWKQLESGFILQSSGDIFQITKTNNTIGGDDISTASNKYFLDSKTAQVYELNGSGDYVVDTDNLVSVPASTPTISIIAKRGTKPTGTNVKAGDYWFDTANNVLELAGGSPVAYAPVTPAQAPVGTRILVNIGSDEDAGANHEIYVAFDKDLLVTTYLEADIGWKVYTDHNFAFLKNSETETSFETYQLLTRASTDTGVWALDGSKYNSINELLAQESATAEFNDSDLADLLDVTMLVDEELLFIEGGKLRTTELKVKSEDLTVGTTALRVTRPLFAFTSSSDKIALRFDATIANYQSPLNPTAAVATSFTAAANAAGVAGTRELITFQKSYTGPQTLATTNVVDRQVGLVNLNQPTTTYKVADTNVNTVTGVLNRVTGANQEEFDLIEGSKASTELTDAFLFDITNTTTLGTYVFTMTVGPLTQSFTVVVEAPKQDILLFVEDTINDKMLTPTSAGVIAINLDKDESVKLNYGIKLLNMEKADDPQTVNYILTRTYSFGTTQWNDLKEDVFAATTVTEESATLLVPDAFLSILRGTKTHTDVQNILTLSEPGTYTYKLEIGSNVRSWSVVVSKFPTLEIVTATLGTEDEADSNVLAIMQSIEAKLDLGISTVIIVEERTEDDGEGGTHSGWSDLIDDINPSANTPKAGRVDVLDHLYLNVKGVNLPAGKIYFQLSNDDSAPVLNSTTDKEVIFDAKTGLATIKMTDDQLGLSGDDFEFLEYVEVYVHIYNSSKQVIGFTSFILAVQDVDNILDSFNQ